MTRRSFGSIATGLELGRWVDKVPQLRDLRQALEARLPGQAKEKRAQSQRLVEHLLAAAFDNVSVKYLDEVAPRLERIAALRQQIHDRYRAAQTFDPRKPMPPELEPGHLTDFFKELDLELGALERMSPAAYLKRPKEEMPIGDITAAADAVQRGIDPKYTKELPPVPQRKPDLDLDEPRNLRNLLDQRDNFQFRTYDLPDGRRVQEASGFLGVPGEVLKTRDLGAQSRTSGGTGDHAGHLIAAMFGTPGDERNLLRQNWKTNLNNYAKLERHWREELAQGAEIKVIVKAVYPVGSSRPDRIHVEWEMAGTGERVDLGNVTFLNPPSRKP